MQRAGDIESERVTPFVIITQRLQSASTTRPVGLDTVRNALLAATASLAFHNQTLDLEKSDNPSQYIPRTLSSD